MRIVKPSVEFVTPLNKEEIYKKIELCGRVCYKSEDKITEDSAEKFIRNVIKRGHESVLEHANITVKFITDRGISHEIVRHRLASYNQESTRYCNYSQERFDKEITVICPSELNEDGALFNIWEDACMEAEQNYFDLLKFGVKPEIARSVLPTCLKTELVMTANIREWRHFIRLRGSKAAHPDIRILAKMLLEDFWEKAPVLVEDIDLEV